MCKTALGHKASIVYAAPDLTLGQILLLRDITVNAITQAEDGYYFFTHATPFPTFVQGNFDMSVLLRLSYATAMSQ